MGCECSGDAFSLEDLPLLESLPKSFSSSQFEHVRNRGSPHFNKSILNSTGIDCSTIEPKAFPVTLENCCFICVNSQNPRSKEEQNAPYNNAIITAHLYQSVGYPVYFIIDPEPMKYFTFLRLVLSQTTKNICVYLTGSCTDSAGTNIINFADEDIPCKRFSDFLAAYKRPSTSCSIFFDCSHFKKVNDCPHSTFISSSITVNSVFLTLDFINNTEHSEDKEIDCIGYLSFTLWKILKENPSLTYNEAIRQANTTLAKFGYCVNGVVQSQNLLNSQVFPNIDPTKYRNQEQNQNRKHSSKPQQKQEIEQPEQQVENQQQQKVKGNKQKKHVSKEESDSSSSENAESADNV